MAWTGRPAWRSHHCSRTGIKLTSRWFTVQPVLHVGTRRIGWSQSNHITTVDNGISMALKGKKTINQSIRWSTFLVKLRGEGEFEDYNNTFHFAVRQYWLIQLIVAGSRLRKFNIFESIYHGHITFQSICSLVFIAVPRELFVTERSILFVLLLRIWAVKKAMNHKSLPSDKPFQISSLGP